MSENQFVGYGESAADTATLLLAAVEELGLQPGVVQVDTTGTSPRFKAPGDVVKKAGLTAEKDESEDVPEKLEGPTADFFDKADPKDPKPEQQVAGETPDGSVAQAAPGFAAMGDGQAGEAEATKRAEAAQAEADAKAEDTKAAKKTAAKKTAAKKAPAKKTASKE